MSVVVRVNEEYKYISKNGDSKQYSSVNKLFLLLFSATHDQLGSQKNIYIFFKFSNFVDYKYVFSIPFYQSVHLVCFLQID